MFLTIAGLSAHGSAVAVASGSAALTYEDLAARAEALGGSLRRGGALPGAAVALVSTGRSFDEAVGLCGILTSGCVAVPLDAAAPPQRLAAIVKSRGCRALVCDEASAALVASIDEALGPEDAIPRVVLDDRGAVSAPAAPSSPGHEVALRDSLVACILHTSGSTGTPKPVPITWEGLDVFTAFWRDEIRLGPKDRVLRVAELVFDLAWFDHLATFRAGATLLIMSRRELTSGRSLKEAVATLGPTVIYGVPSLFMKLGAAIPPMETFNPSLRAILFAGEVFPPKELHAFAAKVPVAELYNLYGPTETNVCTYHHVRRESIDSIRETPIGIACAYSPCELVDEDGTIVSGPGIGELYVRGATTLGGGPYPTRDRVERGADGLFYFRGRIDRMVKIRGYRVEPGEIETALTKHPAVEQAAAFPVDDPKLGKVLHAYVGRKPDVPSTITTDRDLRMYLATVLPPYMVPEKVFILDELPRTTTGKIDYQALGSKPSA